MNLKKKGIKENKIKEHTSWRHVHSEGVTENKASSVWGIDLNHKLWPRNQGEYLDPLWGIASIEQGPPLLYQGEVVRIFKWIKRSVKPCHKEISYMFLYWMWNWSHQKDDRLTLIVHLITSIYIVNIIINILLRFDVNFYFALVVHVNISWMNPSLFFLCFLMFQTPYLYRHRILLQHRYHKIWPHWLPQVHSSKLWLS